MHGDAVLVDLGPRLRVVDDFRQHAVGRFADFDGSLSGARAVDGEISDAEGKNGAETFGEIFFAAIEAVDRDHQRHGAFGIFGQAQVADDLFAFKRNAHDFERRIEEFGVIEKGFKRFFVGALLAGRGRDRPASEGINAPGADVVGVGLGGIGFLEGFGFVEVAVADAA